MCRQFQFWRENSNAKQNVTKCSCPILAGKFKILKCEVFLHKPFIFDPMCYTIDDLCSIFVKKGREDIKVIEVINSTCVGDKKGLKTFFFSSFLLDVRTESAMPNACTTVRLMTCKMNITH